MSYFSNSFTDWDRGIYLAHYGVKGMKWGVRRYLNKQGELTNAGAKRYGENATKKTGARKIQRDFNRLDQSFANVHANRVDTQREFMGHVKKAAKKKVKLLNKGQSEEVADTAVRKKYEPKMDKDAKRYQMYDRQAKGIEALQGKIVGTAVKNKYDVSSKPYKRLGLSNKDRRFARANGFMLGLPGAIPTAVALSRDKEKQVDGQKIKVNKYGTGKIQLVNYYKMNHPKKSRRKSR